MIRPAFGYVTASATLAGAVFAYGNGYLVFAVALWSISAAALRVALLRSSLDRYLSRLSRLSPPPSPEREEKETQ